MSKNSSGETQGKQSASFALLLLSTPDVFTLIYSFTENPSGLRGSCKEAALAWDMATTGMAATGTTTSGSQEGVDLPCSYAMSQPGGKFNNNQKWTTLPVARRTFRGASRSTWFPLQLFITRLPHLTQLEADFILPEEHVDGGTPLQKIHVGDLENVQTIGDKFLAGRSALKTATFFSMPVLNSVGGSWMQGCVNLTKVEIDSSSGNSGGFESLTSIGESWLQGCKNLASFSLRSLPSLTEIGPSFLQGCSSLKDASFVDLPELRHVGTNWLCNCTTLVTLHFEALPRLGARHVGVQDNQGKGFLEDSNHKNILVTFGGNGQETDDFVRLVKELTSSKRNCPVQ